MSLTIVAPASNAASATSAQVVSTEIGTPTSALMTSTTLVTRSFSTETGVGSAPGLEEAPPMSMTSTPQASNSLANETAFWSSLATPSPENESWVAFTMPIT